MQHKASPGFSIFTPGDLHTINLEAASPLAGCRLDWWGLVLEAGGCPRLGGAAGTAGAAPRCGLSQATVTDWGRPPMSTTNTFWPALMTRYGPSKRGFRGGLLAPTLMYTSSALNSCGGQKEPTAPPSAAVWVTAAGPVRGPVAANPACPGIGQEGPAGCQAPALLMTLLSPPWVRPGVPKGPTEGAPHSPTRTAWPATRSWVVDCRWNLSTRSLACGW
jgi:hypothetical protein